MRLTLHQFWDATSGTLRCTISHHGPAPIALRRIALSTVNWMLPEGRVAGGTLIDQIGTYHQIAPEQGWLEPGDSIALGLSGLRHPPLNRAQGIMAAWVETQDGARLPIACEKICLGAPSEQARDFPEGKIAMPLGLLPWPRRADISTWRGQALFSPGDGMDLAAFETVRALHQRLFPTARPVLCREGGLPIAACPQDAPGYRLAFAATGVTLHHNGPEGLRHGLISLAQIAHSAAIDGRFEVPETGEIEDAPRFAYRGGHVDVARNFLPFADLMRHADILVWHKMNWLHLHLTDDEAWRLDCPSVPELGREASHRAPGTPRPPQFSDGAAGQSGVYSQQQMRELIAHCADLGLEILPEIDLPGHCHALLATFPALRDPAQPWGAYRSVGGFPNNAFTPGVPGAFELIGRVLDDVTALFPGELVHLGGDEVDPGTYEASPAAQALARREGIDGDTASIQAWIMGQLAAMLHERGKRLAGWDECADGPGVDPAKTLLFAWRTRKRTRTLLEGGYRVVSTPGQAYYMDMQQELGWDAHGGSWAGPAVPRQSYDYDPAEGIDPALAAKIEGVQAGIWTEFIPDRQSWNHMVFPRLSAVAEGGWTDPERKDWARFCALSRLMPQM